jgi:4-hydroxybenzoate polyprenyltransferase
MTRPSHWVKHGFILPGTALAVVLLPEVDGGLWIPLLVGLASACLAASANYVLNEWLDADSDRHHPSKNRRPAVVRRLDVRLVIAEYLLLLALALLLASRISTLFTATIALFGLAGMVYNVPPLRLKDLAYADVLLESINNPLRLVLGWAIVDSSTLPPSSLLFAYWMGGAFLMAVKRLAEYRAIVQDVGVEALIAYRRSFARYSESSLLVSSFAFAQMAAFFLAVFLLKYRIEYLLSLPFFVYLFACYLRLGLRPGSAAQRPERLLRERALMVALALLLAALAVLTVVDLSWLDRLTTPHYIQLG